MKTLAILIITAISFTAFAQSPDFYAALNKIRSEKGLPELKQSKALSIGSLVWLKKIKDKRLAHDYSHNNYEVITDDPKALAAFMNSPGHRNILLTKKATRIGVAFYKGRCCARLR
jgi:uncharacterized protein YkwD